MGYQWPTGPMLPPLPPKPKAWYEQPIGIVMIVTGGISAVGLVLLLFVNLMLSASANGVNTIAQNVTATADIQATTAPTATPVPTIGDAPTLGATHPALLGKLGKPDPDFVANATYHLALDGIPVALTVHFEPSNDAFPRAVLFDMLAEDTATAIGPSAPSWLQQFLPSDAQFVRNHTFSGQTEKVYVSAKLANTFPASMFVDGSGKALPAGTFSIGCSPAGSQRYHVCELGLGTN